jgi:cyclopropane fatty-acyl-phospholipid synthase-like methyltransferase
MPRDWGSYWQRLPASEPRDVSEALRQVGKTRFGVPIDAAQIRTLVDHIGGTLELDGSDRALDLGCGNGFLTSRLAGRTGEILGLDFSPPLLAVARACYAPSNVRYELADLADVGHDVVPPLRFNKAWSCEVLQHLEAPAVRGLLGKLREALADGFRILLCGIPERSRIRAFYDTPERWERYRRNLASGTEQIGRWWERSEILEAARNAAMTAEIVEQPAGLYTSHYRFDALLRAR